MTGRERFLNAFTDRLPDRPPVWIMRQAGRYLPEYRALKQRYDFLTLVQTPELACEVTLQPLRRYAQLDAAIIFSDILILPEAMGQGYRFREGGGIEMEYALGDGAQIAALEPAAVRERTAYLPAALRLVRQAIGDSKALLGFAGAPWTLATYMIEGGSTRDFRRSHAFYREHPDLFAALMRSLTDGLIELLRSQIEAGVDAVQIFDSWAAAAPEGHYEAASLSWIREVIAALPVGFPVILFAKGMSGAADALARSGARALAVADGVDLADWRQQLPADMTVQGNLAPATMTLDPEAAVAATRALLGSMAPWRRYIFNLGHGITPDARTETVQAVLETIADAKNDTP